MSQASPSQWRLPRHLFQDGNMINSVFLAVARLCGVSRVEAGLYLVLSACGWLYFAHQYIYASGLGEAIPTYAGY
jgi:hypothetical protein